MRVPPFVLLSKATTRPLAGGPGRGLRPGAAEQEKCADDNKKRPSLPPLFVMMIIVMVCVRGRGRVAFDRRTEGVLAHHQAFISAFAQKKARTWAQRDNGSTLLPPPHSGAHVNLVKRRTEWVGGRHPPLSRRKRQSGDGMGGSAGKGGGKGGWTDRGKERNKEIQTPSSSPSVPIHSAEEGGETYYYTVLYGGQKRKQSQMARERKTEKRKKERLQIDKSPFLLAAASEIYCDEN